MASVVEPSSGSRHSPMKLHFMQFAAGGCAGRVPFLRDSGLFTNVVELSVEEWRYHPGSI